MSRVIWKTALSHEKVQVVSLPSEWRPLAFGNQKGTAVIWYEAAEASAIVQRVVHLVFTDEQAPEKARYVGTATFGANGFIVVHCYVQ